MQENHLDATYDVQVFTEPAQIRHIVDRPSAEAIARLVHETGMGALQARRRLQQRAKLQERAMRSHRACIAQLPVAGSTHVLAGKASVNS